MFNFRAKASKSETDLDEGAALSRLTDEIWQDLDGKVSRSQVEQAVKKEAAAFNNAVAESLIHRHLRVKLIKESDR